MIKKKRTFEKTNKNKVIYSISILKCVSFHLGQVPGLFLAPCFLTQAEAAGTLALGMGLALGVGLALPVTSSSGFRKASTGLPDGWSIHLNGKQ